MPFFLYSSNQQENLFNRFLEEVAFPISHPLQSEIIMTHSSAIQKWICIKSAEKLGVCANFKFFFPNEFLEFVFKHFISSYQKKNQLNREMILWKLIDILPSLKEFSIFKHYLEKNDPDQMYQLSVLISQVFDQYMTFRPELLLEWEKREVKTWQEKIWNLLIQDVSIFYRPKLKQDFLKKIQDLKKQDLKNTNKKKFEKNNFLDSFPERIFVFGISFLPPLHLEILQNLSFFIDIHFFFLNPSQEYWSYISPSKTHFKHVSKSDFSVSSEELFLEVGNSLLASMGSSGQAFFNQLTSWESSNFVEEELFEEPIGENLLQNIQRDIFLLNSSQKEKKEISIQDHSIQIHSCHSRMREVEVLYNQILYYLDKNEHLNPQDILVIVTDLNVYSPLVHSIFEPFSNSSKNIPYSIEGNNINRSFPLISSFFSLLKIVDLRFTVEQVFSLLDSEYIRKKFCLNLEDIDQIQDWILGSNICWGINPQHRSFFNVPENQENTWEFGIRRILTGFAIPEASNTLFGNIFPFDALEGNQVVIFGKFLDFFEHLSSLVLSDLEKANQIRSLEEWSVYLKKVLETFFIDETNSNSEFTLLKNLFIHLKEVYTSFDCNSKVSLYSVLDYLQKKVEENQFQGGFSIHGVTFSSLLPLRGIPFKMVAFLGLNQQEFPRQTPKVSFDLMQKKPKLGDRSLKDEDRYLFLETLLATREILYISYIGQSIQDNNTLPPSIVVTELLDYFGENYFIANQDIKQYFLTKHPLQAFSSKYFLPSKNKKLINYSKTDFIASKALKKIEKKIPYFISLSQEEKKDTSEIKKSISLENLISFFQNPTEYYFKNILGIILEHPLEKKIETEPFEFSFLDQYILQKNILQKNILQKNILQKKYLDLVSSEEKIFDSLKKTKAKGILPLSNIGNVAFEKAKIEFQSLSETIVPYIQDSFLPPFEFECIVCGIQIYGVIKHITPNGIVRFRPAKIKMKDQLQIWLEQLIINYLHPKEIPLNSILIGKDEKEGIETLKTSPITNPTYLLENLVDIFQKGIKTPLAFFPETAKTYVTCEQMKQPLKEVQKKALLTWNGNDVVLGELWNSKYLQKCYQYIDIFKETNFETNIQKIVHPFIQDE